MIDVRLRKRCFLMCLALAASATECQSNVVKKAPIASGCELKSDCDPPLVCGFGRCHVECKSSVDCAVGRCLISESGNVCQLPEEVRCEYTSECPPPLKCGVDGQCRNECEAKRDCLKGQICALTGECAEVDEVDMSGGLKLPNAAGSGGTGGEPSAAGGSGAEGGIETNAGSPGSAGKGGAGRGGSPSGGSGPGGSGGSGAVAGKTDVPVGEGVPLTPIGGWVDGKSNALMVQGAIYAYADTTSAMSLVSDFTGTSACMRGTAARIDMASEPCQTLMFTPPATDCYGQYWGAAMGLNLNQTLDFTVDPPMGNAPVPFDASALKGFSFEISGATVPATAAFRFKVESANTEFCNVPSTKLKAGANTFLFSELVSSCWALTDNPPNPTAVSAQSALIKLAWQVVTNPNSTVPYDFCVSNIRAIRK